MTVKVYQHLNRRVVILMSLPHQSHGEAKHADHQEVDTICKTPCELSDFTYCFHTPPQFEYPPQKYHQTEHPVKFWNPIATTEFLNAHGRQQYKDKYVKTILSFNY